MTVRATYLWAALFAALQLTWICEAPMAVAAPNNQSLIRGDEDEPEEEPGDPYPGEPGEPYPGEPGEPYPGDPYPGEPSDPYPSEPYPGEPGEPYPSEPYPGEPSDPHPGEPGDTTTRTTSDGVTRPTGTLVPLYVWPIAPDGSSAWQPLIDQKRAHPSLEVIAVVNPENGPGIAQKSAYTDGIQLLVNANIQVIGYVATAGGIRPVA